MTKKAKLISLLKSGPQSAITLQRELSFSSRSALANAIAEIPAAKRILVDAGCRNIMVYWLEGEYQPPPKLTSFLPALLEKTNAGLTVKQAMRELKIERNYFTVDAALARYRKRLALSQST